MYIYDLAGNVEYLLGVNSDLERTRQVNGELSIKFKLQKMPGHEDLFDLVTVEGVIELPTDNQQYRIKRAQRQSKGPSMYKNVEAHHVFFDIIDNKITREDNKTGSFDLYEMLDFVLGPTDWNYWIESGAFGSKNFENFGGTNCLKLFNDLVDTFRFEFYPDSVEKIVHIYSALGSSSDAQVRYNHNLKTINEDINTSNLATIGTAYGKKTTDEAGNVTSQIIATFRSPNADVFGERWAEDFEDERFTSVETLSAEIQARLIDEPQMSIDIDFIELKKNGSNIHNFDLGDDIFIIHEKWGLDLLSRVLKIVDYPLSNGLKQPKLSISNIRKNVKDSLADAKRLSIEAQKAALAAANKATLTQLKSNYDNSRLNNILDDNGNMTTINKKIYINSYCYADNIGIWAVNPSDPSQYVLLSSGGLDVEKGFIKIVRDDGYATIIGGKLQNSFSIFPSQPSFQTTGVEKIGQFYKTTTNNRDENIQRFTFKHDSRYLRISAAMFTENGDTGYMMFDVIKDGTNEIAQSAGAAETRWQDLNAGAQGYFKEILMDLGVPTGELLMVYWRQYTEGGNACYGAVRYMAQEG
jgi:phage minor structural protein